MQPLKQEFTPRQYMVTPDFEYFHYRDNSTLEVEYHNHDFYEIYYLVSGRVTYIIEGKSYRVKPGDILLVHNKELHRPIIESGEPYERIVIWVNPELLIKESVKNTDLTLCFESVSLKKHNLLRPHSDMLINIQRSIENLEISCINKGYGSDILKNVYLIELIVNLNKAFLETYADKSDEDIEFNEKIDKIIKYINDNLSSELSLDLLSSKFYISKYHLLREFKKYTGYTIHRYIQQKRLIMAKSLLKDGIQVTEVCIKSGFGDYSNFIRAFKKAFGLSPKKYYKVHI